MNLILKPSLQHITLVRIVATLWNQQDIRELIENSCSPFNSVELKKEWPYIEGKVREKLQQLILPKLFIEKIFGVIKPIGHQILKWMKLYGEIFSSINLPSEFCWTVQGTIDEKRTAKMLIKDENLDITTRYKISCIFCLENDILKLWSELPEECKKIFYHEEEPLYVKQHQLVVFWTYDIKGEMSKITKKFQSRCTPYQYACKIATYDGNKAATEYFLKKLKPGEKRLFLASIAESIAYERVCILNKYTNFQYEYFSDILCTLLTHMNGEQQAELFESSPSPILTCFLDWPWQSFYAQAVARIWPFLAENVYDCMLMKMIKKKIEGFKDFDYQKLFTEIWQQSPNAFKRYLLNDDNMSRVLSTLFLIKDMTSIELILRDATLTEKQKIIFSTKAQSICLDLIDNEDWISLKFFIKKCISSKNDWIRFKVEFTNYVMRSCSEDTIRKMEDKWNKFICLLNDIISELCKRKYVEDNDKEAKKKFARSVIEEYLFKRNLQN